MKQISKSNEKETNLAECANNIHLKIENLDTQFSILQKDLNRSESKVIKDIIDKSKTILKDIYPSNSQKKVITTSLKKDVLKLIRNYEIACILGRVEDLEKKTYFLHEKMENINTNRMSTV